MAGKQNKKTAGSKKTESKKPVTQDISKTVVGETATNSQPIEAVSSSTKSSFDINKISSKIKLNTNQIIAIVVSVLAIGITLWVSFGVIPYITDQTDEAKAAREKKENEEKTAKDKKEKEAKLATEAAALNLGSKKEFVASMQIKVADQETKTLKINMNTAWAPKTVENFVRLSYRGYFDKMLFHRMVEQDNFKVIQGGDPTGTGSGGETASGDSLVDELWRVKPEVATGEDGQSSVLTNNPEFIEPSLYADFSKTNGSVTYRKGLILMAKTDSPDSATSQFFITLDKTVLPAQYTVFGVVSDDTMSVLDYISAQADPVSNAENPNLTRPSKDIQIVKVEIL